MIDCHDIFHQISQEYEWKDVRGRVSINIMNIFFHSWDNSALRKQ